MRCNKCGTDNQPMSNFCYKCGTTLSPYNAPASRIAPNGPPTTNGLAVASMILGILGLILGWLLLLIPNILAIVFGHIATSQIRNSGGAQTGRGMAVAGLIMGYLILPIMIIGILAAIAIPAYQGYTQRAAIISLDTRLYEHVRAHVQQHHEIPDDLTAFRQSLTPAEQPVVANITVDKPAGAIVVQFSERLQHGKITYWPVLRDGNLVSWQCRMTDMKEDRLPPSCKAATR